MSTDGVPSRPRLASHVLPRRHVIDGDERIILHDQARNEVLQIGPREWGVLAAADGTRDVEGIVVAARRDGALARTSAVRQLLQTLTERGMVVAGEPAERAEPTTVDAAGERSRPREEPTQADARDERSSGMTGADERSSGVTGVDPRSKPLVPVPGPPLRCNGAGTCCRLYGTVMMSRPELRRVQSLLPKWRVGPVPPERWGMPVRGSEPGRVVASVARDGACGFLQDDGLCAVHRAGGAEAKPWGCRAFPRIYVDDGVSVHVSVKPECPCVIAPTDGDAEPVLDPSYTDAGSLPSLVVVDTLPDMIEVTRGVWAPRAEVRTWFARVADREAPIDAAATAWALADGLSEGQWVEVEAWSAKPPNASVVMPWIEALHRRAQARADEHAAWRSASDLVRRSSAAVALVTRLLGEPEALAEALDQPAPHPDHEARFWQAGVHAYRWAGRGAMVRALRDDAVRLWVARSLPLLWVEADGDPDLRAPLALVEALLRAHGVGAYVDDVD